MHAGGHSLSPFQRCHAAPPLPAVTKRLLPPDTNDAAAVLATCRGLLAELREAVARTAEASQQPAQHQQHTAAAAASAPSKSLKA
jgi:hypothetical protein